MNQEGKKMLELGRTQTLQVVKETDFGVYLSEEEHTEERVLLPKAQVPKNTKLGDKIEVFLYKDSKDRLIATTRTPKIKLHETAVLEILEIGKIGAFVDWGLEKDVMLPFAEQTRRVKKGEKYIMALYVDKSSRLCVTMKVYDYLKTNSPYQKDDTVEGIVYDVSENFGAYVAVDDCYSAMIPKYEDIKKLRPGDRIKARVTNVKEDGKLDLSLREKAYLQMDQDADYVLQVIEEYAGVLPFNDKASPELIKREFGLTKNAFKRAVGRLLKQGKIQITENSIRKI